MGKVLQREKSRNLNGYERFLWTSGLKGSFTTGIVARLYNRIELVDLRRTLDLLQREHYLLRATVVGSKEIRFEEVDDHIPIRVEVGTEDLHWQYTVRDETSRGFASGSLLLMVVCIQSDQSSDLILVAHHLINDGISGIELLKDIVRNLGKDAYNKRFTIPSRHFSFDPLKRVLSHNHNSVEEDKILNAPPSSDSTISTRASKYIHQTLNREETARLLEKSKSLEVSLHALLLGAFTLATKNFFQLSQSVPIKIESPFNLRPYLEEENVLSNEVGCFFGLLESVNYAKEHEDLGSSAKMFQSLIKSNISKEFSVNFLKQTNEWSKNVNSPKEIRDQRSYLDPYIGISNLGKINLDGFENKIKTIIPIVNLDDTFYTKEGGYIIASTSFGCLHLTFVYPFPLMLDDEARQFFSETVQLLKSSCGPSITGNYKRQKCS